MTSDTTLPSAVTKLTSALRDLQEALRQPDPDGHPRPLMDLLRQGLAAPGVPPAGGGDQEAKTLFEKYHSSMQTKLDKVVRQMDDLAEKQQKLIKMVQSLKRKKVDVEDEAQEEDPVKKSPAKSADASSSNARDFWAKNLALVGDWHWQSLHKVPDIKLEVTRLEKSSNFRVLSGSFDTLDRLYDSPRGRLLFALPPRIQKVAFSIGTVDLSNPQLLTLKDDSLDAIRKKNAGFLKEKAGQLVRMAQYLISQNMTVAFLLPPYGEDRLEVFQHWEEVVKEEMAGLPANKVRLINLPEVMRSTLVEFRSQEEYLKMWLSEEKSTPDRPVMSDYGMRRIFDLLQRTLSSRYHDNSSNGVAIEACYRCLKTHPGGEAKCKSKEKVCRRCGQVGHFGEIHDTTDPDVQREICKLMGWDFTGFTRKRNFMTSTGSPATTTVQGVQAKLQKLSQESTLDDWYNG